MLIRIALIGLICVALVLGCLYVDASVSLGFARDQQSHARQSDELLRKLLFRLAKDQQRKPLLQDLKTAFPESIIKEEDNKILIDEVVFEFHGDSLSGVSMLNQANE